MKKIFFIIFLVISCPKPSITKLYELDYFKEAERYYQDSPLYAYNLLTKYVISPEYARERAHLLVTMYIDQREYERAAYFLDSLNWSLDLEQHQLETILVKTHNWNRLIELTDDALLKGLAYYHLEAYQPAVEYLSKPSHPDAYRMFYLAKTYSHLNDYENSLITILGIDSLSPYLSHEYQQLLFTILYNIEDITLIERELAKLNDPALKAYVLLRKYEKANDEKNVKATAWNLIKMYPESAGAYHALRKVQPTARLEHKLYGKVYYYHNQYDSAIVHLTKSVSNSEVNYYLGRIYYNKADYTKALEYLSKSDWAAAYYYRGRIYEVLEQFGRAILVYDSLYTMRTGTDYATRGYKRMAFLLEDIGDTLKAVDAFLKIDEENTKFRAAIQLFKIGKWEEANEILGTSTSPEFVYWRARINEQLGKSTDDLKSYLIREYPLSYYSLVRIDTTIIFDTTSLDQWILQLGDSTLSLSRDDSARVENAIRLFNLNELEYAAEELSTIDVTNPQTLLYLSRLCAQYGADGQSIRYALKLKNLAEKKNIQSMPVELFKLLYPIRYAFTMLDEQCDLSLCLAMIWQESLFQPQVVSPANAKGLMQIIPATAKQIARELGVSSYSVHDAPTSIKFGWYYFSHMLQEFNSIPLSLAGYNAGPHRVKRWITNNSDSDIDEFIELIPYNETRNYVKSVLARQVIYKTLLERNRLMIDSTEGSSAKNN
jgi:soluble lytic murein transglycosylase-like protein